MGKYTDKPTLHVDFLKSGKMRVGVAGSAEDGGRNGLGQSTSRETSGGGMVVIDYENCFVHDPEEHEYQNFLAAYLTGSYRFINVPILTDWAGPFPLIDGKPTPIVSSIPLSDGGVFADGAGYSQTTVHGLVTTSAALNSGTIRLRLYGASRPLRWSDWFSIEHPTKGWRAYRYWRVNSRSEETNPVYDLSISPPLREAVTVGERVEFARPRFVAKLPPGFTLPWEVEGFWQSRPSLSFMEAF